MSDQPPIPDWKASLPEDLRGNPSIADTPDVATLARRFVDTKAMTGKKAYDIPQDDWKPDDARWGDWRKATGVPDSHDKYAYDKELIEKSGLQPEVVSEFLKASHAAHKTPRQVKNDLEWYANMVIKGGELSKAEKSKAHDMGISTLRNDFGDKYESKIGLMKAFFSQSGVTQSILDKIEGAGLGSDPEFVKWAIANGEKLMEATGRSAGSASSTVASKEQAKLDLAAMMADKSQMDRYFKADKEMVAKWRALQKAANPEDPIPV